MRVFIADLIEIYVRKHNSRGAFRAEKRDPGTFIIQSILLRSLNLRDFASLKAAAQYSI